MTADEAVAAMISEIAAELAQHLDSPVTRLLLRERASRHGLSAMAADHLVSRWIHALERKRVTPVGPLSLRLQQSDEAPQTPRST